MTLDPSNKPDEPNPALPLARIFEKSSEQSRESYRRAWERAELVGQVLADVDKRFIGLTGQVVNTKLPRPAGHGSADLEGELHTLSLVTKGSSEHLIVAVPPYDEQWTTFQPPGCERYGGEGTYG